MRLAASGARVIGPVHLQDGVVNQDAIGVYGVRQGWCIAVCDGLGSRRLSHIGSSKAARLVKQHARQALAASAQTLGEAIRLSWLDHFGPRYRDYETTCLWAQVDARGRGQAGQIGDGLLLLKSRGAFRVVSAARQGFGNQTDTLAQADEGLWQTCEFELVLPGDGVLLMTDGISDDLIFVHLGDCHGKLITQTSSPLSGQPPLTDRDSAYLVPAHTLRAGQTYQISIEHAPLTSSRIGPA